MSSPKNIQRDGTYVIPKTTDQLTWPASSDPMADTVTVNAKAAVHSDFAEAHARSAVTIAVDQMEIIGVYIEEPRDDRVPYRIKASALISGQTFTLSGACIVIGYAPASPTGAGDTIDEPVMLPFRDNFDDLVIVENLASGDPNYDRALFIGVGIIAETAVTALNAFANISVQRLAVKPPTMQYSVA